MSNTKTSLEANFRTIQTKTKNLLPENSVLLKSLPELESASRLGRKFTAPVQLQFENGVTYGDGTAFALNPAVAGVYEEIEVDANPVVLNTTVSESAANRMANKDKFLGEGVLRTLGMYESLARRCEISMLYGQSGIGTADSSTNVNATTTDIVFTAASWSAGIASGTIGAEVQFYQGASLVSSGTDAVFSVTSVNMETLTWRVTGTSAGIAALDTALAAAGTAEVYFRGSKTNDMLGLDKQIVGGAAYFGIDPTQYNLWQGNTHNAAGQLTMGKILKAAAKCVARGGLTRGSLELHCSAATYSDLNADVAALRRYDDSYSSKKADQGSQELRFFGAGVEVIVKLNNIVKQGEAFLLPMAHIKRIGAKDIGFVGWDGKEEFFKMMESVAAYQLRMSAEFSILLDMPARACKITGIVNAA